MQARVDVNTAWTLQDARWGLKGLQDAGCELVEQPVPARHRRAMAELAAGYEIAVMADEALGGPEDALEVAQARAADVFAVKVAQSGGLKRAAEVVAIAQAAGLGLYGGTMLETGLGTAAALQLFATVETLHWGCEFFGPLLLTDEILANLNALINACSHRGAQLCRFKRRNQKTFTCPFHGWTFSNTGKLLKLKDPNGAGYPEQFNKDGSHDLTRVARFENYRGFLFGSLNADVQPLEEYLGEARKMIDMIVDQADEGLEVLRGSSTYTYDGNWKLQAENGADGYHVSAVHWNYVATTAHRTDDGKEDAIKATDASKWAKQRGGFHAYDIGHILLWTQWADPTNRPNYPRLAEWTERFGKTKADWMVGVLRNLCLYPNVFLMDQFSSQIRVFRPVSVDKTEVTIYCIAPKGEAPDARARRIRQYEDFFNASGMATPDDTEEFRATQRGHAGATHAPWNDLTRGAVQWIKGPDADASALGINPILSGARTEDEGLFVIQHTNWSDRTAAAVARERATAPAIATAAE